MIQSDTIQEASVIEPLKNLLTPGTSEEVHFIALLIVNMDPANPLKIRLEIGGMRASRDVDIAPGDSFDFANETKYLVKPSVPVTLNTDVNPNYAVYAHIQRITVV